MNHPYRGAGASPELSVTPGVAGGCFFCKIRSRVRLRRVLLGGAAILFLAVNVTSALLAHASLRDAKRALASATALDSKTRQRLDRYEADLRKPTKTPAPKEKPAPPPSPPSPDVPGIYSVDSSEFYVERSVFDDIVEHGAERLGSTRIFPERKGGAMTGFRVFGVEPNTLLAKLGLRNGDTIEAVNGCDLTSPDRAIEAYARVGRASDVTLRVLRSGSSLNLRYHLG
jgi:membrane-associated protease RseP (regulator of RpoE activity)